MRGKHIVFILIILLIAAAAFLVYSVNRAGQDVKQAQENQTSSPANSAGNNAQQSNEPALEQSPAASDKPAAALTAPLGRVSDRVTKKPFGIYITPATSPVEPEKFQGYHTGVDFETFAEEQTSDVSVKAVCTGKLLVKRTASGYGGVAVQSCALNDQAVTIVYGHMRLASISAQVGEILQAGQQIGLLGTGFSSETDGERKHLHLGIHKGTAINIAGYVADKASLNNWLNILDYI
jgi:murein DD-endopeptidase MepM/ murein hydrolase activator NlpD